jgi:hypothetical protein
MDPARRFKTALDELRMLMIGAEIRFGFQFNAVFQEGFGDLGAVARRAMLVALLAMVATIALVITVPSRHRIADGGLVSWSARRFATTIAALALVPFAISLGLDIFIVLDDRFDAGISVAGGIGFTLVAMAFWYGSVLVWRPKEKEAPMSEEHVKLETRIEQMLTEARVILPGAQAMLGFQLIAMMTRAFDELPPGAQVVHACALGAVALSIIVLIAPAAIHRLSFDGAATHRFLRIGATFVGAALTPLALGIAADVYVAARRITDDHQLGLVAAIASGLAMAMLWYGYPLLLRRQASAKGTA